MNIENTVFITLDTDWASDEIMEYVFALLRSEGVPATILATHESKLFRNPENDSLFDLGIHPSFDNLLNGNGNINLNYTVVIKELKKLFPKAKCVRSHALVNGTRILKAFKESGFTHDLNMYIPAYSGIKLIPFYLDNFIRIPFFWEDDLFCKEVDEIYNTWNVDFFLESMGLKVFNFHPIHIFLNTDELAVYENSREYHKDYDKLKKYCNKKSTGTRSFLMDLINKAKSRGMQFGMIRDVIP